LSKRTNPSGTTSVKSAEVSRNDTRIIPQDFWGNIIYFVIVSSAIFFVLVNNPLSRLMTTTGIVVLAVLFIFDLFAIIPLSRILLTFIILRTKKKNR